MSLLKVNEVQNYNGSSLTLTASTVSTSAQLNTGGNISVTGSINVSDDSTTRSNLGLGSIATQAADSVTITGGSVTGTEIDLKSSGTTIYASDGTTAVLSESSSTVTVAVDDVQSDNLSSSSGITVISLPATGTTSASIGANNTGSTRQDVIISAYDGGTSLPFYFQKVNASGINAFYCLTDNTADLGRSAYRFDDIYATNATIQTSDANEKENITSSDLSLDFIRRLNPVSYRFIGKTRTHYGLIAQEIETLLSTIGKETTDFAGFIKSPVTDDDGNETGEYKYGLRYSEFISPMIKAIQEQQTQIDALTARIDALETA